MQRCYVPQYTRDVQSRGAIAPNRVRNPSIRVSSNSSLRSAASRRPRPRRSRVESRTRPTSFRLACRIFECIRSRSLLRRFRRGFGVSSRSVDPCVILLMISRNNAPGNSRELHTYVCIRTLHYENRLRRLFVANTEMRDCETVLHANQRQRRLTTTFTYVYIYPRKLS